MPLPSSSPSRRLATALVAVLMVGLVTTGCGAGEDANTGPSTPASPSLDATASAPPAAPAAPTAPATPAVEPAAGPVIESPVFTARLPTGWKHDKGNSSPTVALGYDSATGADVTFGFFPHRPSPTLDQYEQAALKTWGYDSGPKINERVDVNGVEMFLHTGRKRLSRMYVVCYGAPHAGFNVEFEFHLSASLSRKERTRIVQSVLATVEWKDAS